METAFWTGYCTHGWLQEQKTDYLGGWLEGALIGPLRGHCIWTGYCRAGLKKKRLTTWEAGLKESRLAPAMFVDMAPGMARLPAIQVNLTSHWSLLGSGQVATLIKIK